MQVANLYRKNSGRSKRFPRTHIIACLILVCTVGSMLASIPANYSHIDENNNIHIPISLVLQKPPTTSPQTLANLQRHHQHNNDSNLPNEPNWEAMNINSNESLHTIFREAQIPTADYRMIKKSAGNVFEHIGKNQRLIFQFADNENRQLKLLRYKKSLLETYVFTREGNKFKRKDIIREPQIHYIDKRIVMDGSLSNSLNKVDKSLNIASIRKQLQQALDGNISLQRAQKGDNILLLLEQKSIDGTALGYGNILAAEYEGKRKDYTAYRYQDRKGKVQYYSPKVTQRYKTVRKPTKSYFLRSPVPGARISSGYSLNRLHPILHIRRPHRGTDFAARTGTPVLATADGKVIRASRSRANGNFIVLKHGSRYTTKYLHLHKRYVRAGDYVKRGQKIGSVGATGLARGAHLHYEFLVNNVHKNPTQVSRYTPKAYKNVQVAVATPGAIPQNERKRFFNQTRGIRLQFAAITRGKKEKIAVHPSTDNTKPSLQLAALEQQ